MEKAKVDIENNVEVEEIPLTFRYFESKYKWPTERALRKMAFERELNGLKPAFVKFRKRILVLPQTLFRLIREGGVK
jgi:hypothetical protein